MLGIWDKNSILDTLCLPLALLATVVLNSSTNFVIYCLLGSDFRQEFLQLMTQHRLSRQNAQGLWKRLRDDTTKHLYKVMVVRRKPIFLFQSDWSLKNNLTKIEKNRGPTGWMPVAALCFFDFFYICYKFAVCYGHNPDYWLSMHYRDRLIHTIQMCILQK